MIRRLLLIALATLTALGAAALPAQSAPDWQRTGNAAVQAELAQVRQATAAYHDIERALADGYVQVSPCVDNMGYHFQRGLAGSADDLDATAPEILVYAPRPDGGLRLVAVEYASWDPASTLFGVAFDAPHAGGPPFHTLHAWVWQGNPDGTFSPTNPTISCG